MADQTARVGRQDRWFWHLPLAAALGAGAALGQAPWDILFIAILCFACGCFLFRTAQSARASGWTGWAFGTGYFALALSWIPEPFMVDAARDGWMAPFALVGISGGLALFWALPFWLAHRFRGGLLLLVPLWALAEMARGTVLTGFPWGLPGYAWAPVPAVQWAAVIGTYGLSFVLFTIAAMLATLRASTVLIASAVTAALIGTGAWMGGSRAPDADAPVVRLIQPNAAQHEKWNPDKIPTFFNRQVDYTAAESDPRPDLIVWSETALPTLLNHADEALAIISDAAGPVPVVLGLQREEDFTYYNSAIVLDGSGTVTQIYDKHHLVPFGEYMPFPDLFRNLGIEALAQRVDGSYGSGPGPRLLDLGKLGQALPLICYEAVFPQDLRGTDRPRFLLQLTNDAWFGQYSGPYQHLAQARFRAIEQGLPLLRAANTGVSAVFDARGRMTASLGLGQAGYVDAALPAALPPTIYSRTGDSPLLVLLVLLSLGAIWRATRVSR
ncbi:apolipoprotein N-acyltransferase [Primorskyibacter flagellatus]|uniref:Apolipoprotein N-acyltransferase n=1 Tax=Primorskyibacter flagellatus TaxID=1387277 RepID=A0A1W2D0G8_9RHOB|nr:apolipoprotein N-acyltransferase [Primorskyibacter flagellatus]SMC91017.1 Apolipoprotein N-acyltransferase [Primorskyibacter flagellatus]